VPCGSRVRSGCRSNSRRGHPQEKDSAPRFSSRYTEERASAIGTCSYFSRPLSRGGSSESATTSTGARRACLTLEQRTGTSLVCCSESYSTDSDRRRREIGARLPARPGKPRVLQRDGVGVAGIEHKSKMSVTLLTSRGGDAADEKRLAQSPAEHALQPSPSLHLECGESSLVRLGDRRRTG